MIGEPGTCAEVLLDLPARRADRLLTYRLPDPLRRSVQVGTRVLVPLGPRTAHGFVIAVRPQGAPDARELRGIEAVADPQPYFTPQMLDLARWLADRTLSTLLEAVHSLIPPEVIRRARDRAPSTAVLGVVPSSARRMGTRQAAILEALRSGGEVAVDDLVRAGGRPALRRLVVQGAVVVRDPVPPVRPAAVPSGEPPPDGAGPAPQESVLLWGDPEARQRWILAAAAGVVRGGGQVLLAVPEIALVPDLRDRVRAALGDRLAELHSEMPERARRGAWARIVGGRVDVVIGTRSALFAPLERLRLIVVDEEQDPAYKADGAPRYHGREVALRRGAVTGARVVLGAEAPSVETYAEVASGRIACVRLAPTVAAPRIGLIDMRAERRRGHVGLLSRTLVGAMRRHLRAGGRVALFVNRVGYARVLLCQECGRAVVCPRCDVPMPYDGERRTISCRICGLTAPAPAVCPRCRGVSLRWFGAGTERVEAVIGRIFPDHRVARLDRETAPQFDNVIEEFRGGRLRIVVGTQLMLRARRLRPSLVGVLDADLSLYLPDFRAGERTFQQLRAVVSLAAGADGGEAVVQTRVPDHPAIAALVAGDEAMYRAELEVRRQFGYPPYTVLARVVAAGPEREAARALAELAAAAARRSEVDVLGPAPARGLGAHGVFRYQFLLRAVDGESVRAAARAALAATSAVRTGRLTAEMDPQETY
ncbi:MAG TPA: primosomal protein N' [bacterium]|nr:primosomal protein N' [bacterium]